MKTLPAPTKVITKSQGVRETKSGIRLIQYPKADVYLSEISQDMSVKLALMERESEKTFKEITPFVQCYDFLCDCYSASAEKTDFSIYGFSWKGSKNTPDKTGIYLSIKFPSKQAKENFEKNIHFLHEIENKNKIPLTELHTLGTQSAISIGNVAWLANCLTLRLYLFLFRAFSYEIKTNDWIEELSGKGVTDSQYVKNCERENWNKILDDLSSIHTNYFCGLSFKDNGTGSVHHNSGFFSTFSTHREINTTTVRAGKHWQEMKKRGFKLRTK